MLTEQHETNKKQRIGYFDLLRIIAIILVVFNHTGSNGYAFFFHARESFFYPAYIFISAFDKIAVPLFFMISGALLIPKEESYKDVIKRFLRFALVLLVGTISMYVYAIIRGKITNFTIKEFVTALYSTGAIVPYWYLYAYLAYILMLPFIRKIAEGLSDKDFLWLFFIATLAATISILDYTLFQGKYKHNSHFSFFITGSNVFFPIVGYYLEHKMNKEFYHKKTIILLIIATVLSLSLTALLTHLRCNSLQVWSEEDLPFFGSLIFVPTITVFVGVKMLFMHHPAKGNAEKVLRLAAGTTFGLYLFELIFETELKFILKAMKTVIHPYIACWLWVLIVCIIGGGVVFLIRLIPGVKKLI